MASKKGKRSSILPHVDRSRALPVRSNVGFWKVLAAGACVGALIYIFGGPDTEAPAPQPTTVEMR